MAELKPGWKRVKFGDLVHHIAERAEPTSEDNATYIGLEHLDSGSLTVRRWGSATALVGTKLRMRRGDILFAKRNAYLRRVAIAPHDGLFSAHGMVLRPKPPFIVPEFLPFFMQSEVFMERAETISVGSLSPTINWKTLAVEQFALPPLEEQRRIAHVLKWTRATADQLFEVALRIRDLKRAAIREQIPSLARGKYVKLAALAQVVRGSTPRPANDPRYFNGSFVPWITVGEITADDAPYLTRTSSMLTEAGAGKSRLLNRGTVVLSNSGFSLGVPKILSIDGCANDGVAAFLNLDVSVNPLFLYYVLWGMTEIFRTRVAAGGDQPNLNTQRIGAVEIPVPSRDDQESIAEFLIALDRRLAQLLMRQQELKHVVVSAILPDWRIER